MESEINWDAVLPGEVDWDAVLPDHQWKPYGGSNWEDVMPPPRQQLLGILPDRFDGLCAVHCYSETLTAWLRLSFDTNDIAVDLPRLLHLAAAKGFLTADGSNFDRLGNLAKKYGIPLEGEIPAQLHEHKSYKLVDAHADAYATNTSIHNFGSRPMPFCNRDRTPEVALQVIEYRERLCDILDLGPVVLCYATDNSYGEERQEREPYCRRNKSWFFPTPTVGHCVTAYGYECPGGDVRTLRVKYQENMIGAPGDNPGRLLIHPDAIDSFHVTGLKDILLTNTPTEGYMMVKQPTPPKKWWEKTIF